MKYFYDEKASVMLVADGAEVRTLKAIEVIGFPVVPADASGGGRLKGRAADRRRLSQRRARMML